jgi:1-phosphofructokinase
VSTVSVFSPMILLTITVEDGDPGPEIHLHAGGQGFWVARLLAQLQIDTELVAPLGGESGTVLEALVPAADVRLRAVVGGAASGAYVHDRRSGDRHEIAHSAAAALSRHHVDDLYGAALTSALAADVVVVTGSTEPCPVPDDLFGRLVADVRDNGPTTVCDLSGTQLAAAVDASVDVAKVSHEELVEGGWATGDTADALVEGAERLRGAGVGSVVVSRAEDPTLVVAETVHEVLVPKVDPFDHRGAGDSMTAGIAAGLASGYPLVDAAKIGAAAGALNTTRHGLGSGRLEDILEFCAMVDAVPHAPAAG